MTIGADNHPEVGDWMVLQMFLPLEEIWT